jgi:hypothetical protein
VTRTETVPPALGPGGTTAVIVESETTVNVVAIVEPKAIAVAFVKPEPLIETVFPPETGPEEGLTFVIVGAGIVDTAPSMLNEHLSFLLAPKCNQGSDHLLSRCRIEPECVRMSVRSGSNMEVSHKYIG